MTQPLKNKTALITGASRGIGRAVALQLGMQGADIVIHYRSNKEEAESLAAELVSLGVTPHLVAADLSDLDEVKRFLQEVVSQFSKIDIYVANAAATAFKPLSEIREHHIQKTMNITITSFILAVNALRPLMRPGSKVITVSGIDTKKYCVNHGLLAAAKAGLEMLTRYFAMESIGQKIFFHGINPGIVDTDSMKIYFGGSYEEVKENLSRMIPAGSLMPPKDVAEMIAFLCSPAADWMNGETLYADGGLGFMMPGFSGR